jgi:hypothetical protein
MGESNGACHEPSCLLAHDLVNKLSIIIGCCDLLIEEAQPFSQSAARLGLIHDAAECMAMKLNEHQCKLSEATRKKAGGDEHQIA